MLIDDKKKPFKFSKFDKVHHILLLHQPESPAQFQEAGMEFENRQHLGTTASP
jgi:hypothetical protein